jgi:hypothetical protein
MKGQIAEKRGRYYPVFDIGQDPATGKRRHAGTRVPTGRVSFPSVPQSVRCGSC